MNQTQKTNRRVLILEDDASLSLLLRAILRSVDLDLECDWVATTERATEALTSGTPYSLIIADYSLQGATTGLDFYETAHRLWPNLPFLLMSAIRVDEFLGLLGSRKADYPPFIPKPLDIAKCRETISQLLR
jgi:DNA-binding NtrC family response regulator